MAAVAGWGSAEAAPRDPARVLRAARKERQRLGKEASQGKLDAALKRILALEEELRLLRAAAQAVGLDGPEPVPSAPRAVVVPDVITYNAAISTCEKGHESKGELVERLALVAPVLEAGLKDELPTSMAS